MADEEAIRRKHDLLSIAMCRHRVRLGQVFWEKVRDSRVRPGAGGGLSKHQALSYAAKCFYYGTGDEVPQGR